MTWKDFKAAVDAKLLELDKTEDVEIWYIDVCYPTMDEIGKLSVNEDGDISLSD